MKDRIILSREDCYAGKKAVEVLPASPEVAAVLQEPYDPYLYLQLVEGCGYTPVEVTPDEADQLAASLTAQAARVRRFATAPAIGSRIQRTNWRPGNDTAVVAAIKWEAESYYIRIEGWDGWWSASDWQPVPAENRA